MWKPYKITEQVRISEMYSLFEARYDYGYSFAGESHDFWECLYVIDGGIRVSANKRIYNMKKGEIIFHKPLEIHKFDVTGKEGARLLIFSFTLESDISDFFKNKVFALNEEQKNTVSDFLIFLRKEAGASESSREIKYTGLLASSKYSQTAVLYIYRLLLSLCGENTVSYYSESPDAAVFYNAVNYMNSRICEQPGIKEIADYCGTSASSLKRIFFKYSGLSVHRYFLKLKINAAAHLLENGSSVCETAEKLGFSSQGYFSFAFKRETGFPPSRLTKKSESS